MKFPRLLQAKALPDFQLWVRFQDNTEAVIDFREQLAFPVMRSIATPAAFARVCIAESGSYLYWDVDVPPTERPDASSDWLYLQSVSAELREEFATRLAEGEDWQQTAENLLHKWQNVVVAGIVLLVILVRAGTLSAQTPVLDSLQNALKTAKDDTNKVRLLLRLAEEQQGEPAISRVTAEHAYALATQLGNTRSAAEAMNRIAFSYNDQGNFSESLRAAEQALALAKSAHDKHAEVVAYPNIGTTQGRQGNYDIALDLFFKILPIQEENNEVV